MQDESNHRSNTLMVYWADKDLFFSFHIINDDVVNQNIHSDNVPSEWHFWGDWTRASTVELAFTGEGGIYWMKILIDDSWGKVVLICGFTVPIKTYLHAVTPSEQVIKCHCNQMALYCVTPPLPLLSFLTASAFGVQPPPPLPCADIICTYMAPTVSFPWNH